MKLKTTWRGKETCKGDCNPTEMLNRRIVDLALKYKNLLNTIEKEKEYNCIINKAYIIFNFYMIPNYINLNV